MHWIDSELQAQIHNRQLLQEAERERQVLQARSMNQQLFWRKFAYLIGSSLTQWGQRLECYSTSHAS
jgi:hypothetical protein